MKNNPLPIQGKIVGNKRLCDEHYLMSIALSGAMTQPLPGQFVMVAFERGKDVFLGRPFSIYRYENSTGRGNIQILYRVVGKGTRLMSRLKRGDGVKVFGPHGKPFDIYPDAQNILLVSGGIGMAPMTYLASYYQQNLQSPKMKLICYIGARTADHILELEHLASINTVVHVSTDDGSTGYHGMVTELFSEDLPSYQPDQTAVYACGPLPMLKRLSELLLNLSMPCHVLLEQRMACGIGACLGCVVKVKAADGNPQYKRVCKDGPVFNIRDIVWE